MALQQDTTDERFGNLIKDAYIKLVYVRWSDADMKAMATYSIFASKEAKDAGKEVITNIEIDVTAQFANIQAQMYTQIKKDANFSNAKDI